MRLAALACFCFFVLSACGQQADSQTGASEQAIVETVKVMVSDELPGLTAPPTSITFWEHPSLSFNSLMIVANAEGVVAYNIEDGNEVSSIPGIDAGGAAVSYVNFGPSAASIMAVFDNAASAFAFYLIDAASRAPVMMAQGPVIRGAMRGFCFGRGAGVANPSLFVVQRGKVSIFNLEPEGDTLVVASEAVVEVPDDLASCAIDIGGVLLLASQSGEIYRLDSDNSFAAPFASANASEVGDLAVIAANIIDGETPSITGQVILLDKKDGALHIFNQEDGRALGVVRAIATDEIEGVSSATVIGVTSANLGGLYRDGLVAFGVGLEAPVIRLIPLNGLLNALSAPEGRSISPRGAAPEPEDDGLLIETGFQPE